MSLANLLDHDVQGLTFSLPPKYLQSSSSVTNLSLPEILNHTRMRSHQLDLLWEFSWFNPDTLTVTDFWNLFRNPPTPPWSFSLYKRNTMLTALKIKAINPQEQIQHTVVSHCMYSDDYFLLVGLFIVWVCIVFTVFLFYFKQVKTPDLPVA